jgi:hypothetical protein
MSQIVSGQSAAAITPNDTTDLARVTRGIYVATTGALKVDMADSSTVTFTGLAAGVIHPIAAKRVYATGTGATGIVGVY